MNRRGFTLMEVLVALAILGLLSSLIYGVYSSTERSRRAATETTDAIHAAAAVAMRLTDELAMSFQAKDRIDVTRFEVDSFGGDSATLEFTTRTPAISGIRPGGDTRILYELIPDREGDDGAMLLLRTEMGDPYGQVNQDGWSIGMLAHVRGFRVECYKEETQEWLTSWGDPNDPDPPLPAMVRVEILYGDEKNPDILRTATPIYGTKP